MALVRFTLRISGLDPDGETIAALEAAEFGDSLMGVDRHGDGGTLEVERPGIESVVIEEAVRAAESAGVTVEEILP